MMNDTSVLPVLILLLGITVIATIISKASLNKIGIPPLVGYIFIGMTLHVLKEQWGVIATQETEIIEFFADIGIICLLFRVGLESKLQELINQLNLASGIWLGNVLVSGLLALATSIYILHLPLITSLFIATAMTATSVGIPVSIWQDAKAINSPEGELMLDVAEMDDISAVLMMALLFTLVPAIHNGDEVAIIPLIGKTVGEFFLKGIIFAVCCFFFSRYLEPHITGFFRRLDPPADFTLMIVGIGFFLAAISALLGFSEAIGAFFAGLVFSRDPEAVKIDASFEIIYDLFVPFFFIAIGLKIEPTAFITSFNLGLILVIVAVAGKLIGAGLPAKITLGWTGAILIGISMVPRAEIMMVVMQKGLQLGDWAVNADIFAAMVIVSTITSIISPLFLRPLLRNTLV